ncbi:IclR family transcriptional regulator [Alicyclobacillus sp. SO9]|uniref:IclR family transcriptional regulator n=1 Tax=Alicyclobacillus sp. SO9 TaxID=2665646 RepID=UPI0018E7BBB2|nr:IclR family transcriptional regulator [Alicyclobacillus sp. SO9]QQE79797.1 IclR family transcriptional regulator [Alicyclobacillus sp. SO9]
MREIQMQSIRAIDRAVDVLESFTYQNPQQTINEISKNTSIAKATVYRILYTLERRGLVRFDKETNTYQLGFKFLGYGDLVTSTLDLRQEAVDWLNDLYIQTGHSVIMAVLEHDAMVYIYRKETPEGLKVASFQGPRRPPVFGAFGYVIMAHMETETLNTLLSEPIPQFTPNTVTDIRTVKHRLKRIHEEQVYVETDEAILGVTGIASPVFNSRNEFVAAVGIDGPSVYLQGENLQMAKQAVLATAQNISRKMGALIL